MRSRSITVQQIRLGWSSDADIDEVGKSRAVAEWRIRFYIHQLGVRLSLAMLLLSAAAISVGRSITLSDSLASIGFAICHDSPCFRELEPGQTAWETARRFHDTVVVFDPLRERIHVSRSRDGNSLGTITINLSPSAGATIGKLVALYGTPCRLGIVPKYQSLVLYYPRLYATASFVNSQLSPDAPVRSIMMSDPAEPSSACETNADAINTSSGSTIYRRWQGFVSLGRYYNATAYP